jgi:hypothetical protein
MDQNPAREQTPWECRWTRLGNPFGRNARWQTATKDAIWVCVRSGGRRYVGDEECETCELWEPTNTE